MKITCRIVGGIGNQLFIYAAARRLAITNKADLFVDCVSGFERDRTYKRSCQLNHFLIPNNIKINNFNFTFIKRIGRYLSRKINNILPFKYRTHICQSGDDFDSRLLEFEVRRNILLEGYWQSERYFKDVESTIRSDLRFIPPVDIQNYDTANQIRSCVSVAVHVRFFDRQVEIEGSNVALDYYERAIAYIDALVPDAHFFLFSDQPVVALERLAFPQDRVTLVDHNQGDQNAYADLWLMSLCQNFIIANSTFSWWGAWLSVSPDKIVVAPDVRLTNGVMAWGFEGLLPDEWIKL
jgi:hypothetical protein